MKKIVEKVYIDDINWAESLEMELDSREYVKVRIVDAAFCNAKEVDDFAKLLKEMVKGLST